MRLGDYLEGGPFTLAMSSGFFGFYAHTGMLSALLASGLKPARIVGSSAGALVGGCYAAGLSADELKTLFFELRREDFWDFQPGLGLLAGELMDGMLREKLPVHSFEDLKVPFACSVFHLRTRKTRVIAEGDLPLALRASAALPVLFQPVKIGGESFMDGGILDRPAFAPIEGEERALYHHLSSRSPFRVIPGPEPEPRRAPSDVAILNLGALPRVSPFRLDLGPKAWEVARERTLRALSEPLRYA